MRFQLLENKLPQHCEVGTLKKQISKVSERSRRVKGKRDYCQPDPRFAVTRNLILELLNLGYEGWLVREQMTFEWLKAILFAIRVIEFQLHVNKNKGTECDSYYPWGEQEGWTLCQSHLDSWRQKWFIWSMRQASVMLLSESEHLQPDVFRIYPDLSGPQTHMLAVLDNRSTNARTTG